MYVDVITVFDFARFSSFGKARSQVYVCVEAPACACSLIYYWFSWGAWSL